MQLDSLPDSGTPLCLSAYILALSLLVPASPLSPALLPATPFGVCCRLRCDGVWPFIWAYWLLWHFSYSCAFHFHHTALWSIMFGGGTWLLSHLPGAAAVLGGSLGGSALDMARSLDPGSFLMSSFRGFYGAVWVRVVWVVWGPRSACLQSVAQILCSFANLCLCLGSSKASHPCTFPFLDW